MDPLRQDQRRKLCSSHSLQFLHHLTTKSKQIYNKVKATSDSKKKTQDKITISPQPKSATTKEELRDDNQLIIELTGSSGQFVICC